MSRFQQLIALAVIVGATACGGRDASADAAPSGGAPAAVVEHASSSSTPLDDAAVQNFRLSSELVSRATRANDNIAAVLAANPALEQQLKTESDHDDGSGSLAEMVSRIESKPPLAHAIGSAGITTRDWMLTMLSAMSAGFAYAASQQRGRQGGATSQLSAAARENLRFYGAHEAEMRRFGQSLKALQFDE